jgi:hypothetical protein
LQITRLIGTQSVSLRSTAWITLLSDKYTLQ